MLSVLKNCLLPPSLLPLSPFCLSKNDRVKRKRDKNGLSRALSGSLFASHRPPLIEIFIDQPLLHVSHQVCIQLTKSGSIM